MGSPSAQCPMSTGNKRMVLTRPRGHDSSRSYQVGQLLCDYTADFLERCVDGRVSSTRTLIGDHAQGLEVPLSGFRARVLNPLCSVLEAILQGEPGGVVERKGVSGWVGGLARGAPTTNKARTQFAVRADVKDGDVYLDLGSPVFAKATKPSSSSLMQGD